MDVASCVVKLLIRKSGKQKTYPIMLSKSVKWGMDYFSAKHTKQVSNWFFLYSSVKHDGRDSTVVAYV